MTATIRTAVYRIPILILLFSCATENDKDPDINDSAVISDDTGVDSGDSNDSGDPGDTHDSGDGDSGDTASPIDEVCDGLDNDGDGEIDEDEVCAHEVRSYEGHAYLFVDMDMSWSLARDLCEGLGYTLVKIEDEAENAWLHEQVYAAEDGMGLLKAHTWIGLADPSATWAWTWTDGEAPTYEYWSGEIIKDGFGTTHFGQAAAFGDHEWSHWLVSPANWEYRAVCESDGGLE